MLALAIIDDLGAIIIIAVFYTAELSLIALILAGIGVAGLVALNSSGVSHRATYMLVGVGIWVYVVESGIHATLAGVIVGVAMPLNAADGSSPAHDLEDTLHPWVAFGVLPIFALANVGLVLTDIGLSNLLQPVQLGIGFGLFIGKLGVIGSIWAATGVGLATLHEGTDWRHIYGVAVLTGTGFTMSLFMGPLAFPTEAYDVDIRLAVLLGSVISAICGYLVLRRASSTPHQI